MPLGHWNMRDWKGWGRGLLLLDVRAMCFFFPIITHNTWNSWLFFIVGPLSYLFANLAGSLFKVHLKSDPSHHLLCCHLAEATTLCHLQCCRVSAVASELLSLPLQLGICTAPRPIGEVTNRILSLSCPEPHSGSLVHPEQAQGLSVTPPHPHHPSLLYACP